MLLAAAKILIQFHQYAPAAQDKLHRRNHASMVYRSRRQKIDVIKVEVSAAEACARYVTDPNVARCEESKRLEPKLPPCPPAAVEPPMDPNRILALTSYTDCDPFEPEDVRLMRPREVGSYGALTPFWAQEAVGADLVGPFLDGYDREHSDRRSEPVNVGLIDGGFTPVGVPRSRLAGRALACVEHPHTAQCPDPPEPDPHGTQVASIMAGPAPVGTGARIRLTRAEGIKGTGELVQAADRVLSGPDRPRIVNMSMGCIHNDCTGITADTVELLNRSTTMVVAASNDFPAPIYDMPKNTSSIIVGSTDPMGLLSEFSQEGPEVTITAPSDHEVAAFEPVTSKKGRVSAQATTFNGTSGAAPVVTGSLSNVMSLLPGVTTAQLKIMMRMTAVRTLAYRPGNGKNGPGQLNAYALVRAAARLRLGNWPANVADLSDPATYDFTDEAKTLRQNALKELESLGCASRRRAVLLLRRSFLLNPENGDTRALLARLYRSQGYVSQAIFYERPAVATAIAAIRTPGKRFAETLRHGIVNEAMFDDIPAMEDRRVATQVIQIGFEVLGAAGSAPLLRTVMERGTSLHQLAMLKAAETIEDTALRGAVVRTAMGARDRDVRVAAVAEAARFPVPSPIRSEVYFAAARDPDREVRWNAFSFGVQGLAGQPCQDLLEILRRDSDSVIRAKAAAASCGS